MGTTEGDTEERMRGFGWRMPFPPPWGGPGATGGPGALGTRPGGAGAPGRTSEPPYSRCCSSDRCTGTR